MEIRNGAVLGPYEIVDSIGAGGMGEVYRALDLRLDRHVALKVLPRHLASSAELRSRFEREARAISALSHPHICSLFDIGTFDGLHYLVMELLDGETLADRVSRGPMPIEQVLRYGIEIASALDRAHRDGMVHRDLKPGNIMLTRAGAKLLDFGLARLVAQPQDGESVLAGATEQKPLTAEGTVLGTFQYMAPEQIEGRPADARTDLFAFGAVLYEMLTGRRAFDGKSRASVVAAVMSQEPQPITSIQPLVPPALERVIRTCLAKDPEDRWQTAHDVMLQLRWIAEGGSQAGAPAAVTSRRRVREQVAWSLAALLALAFAVSGALLLRERTREAPRLRVVLPGRTAQFSEASYRRLSPDGTFTLFSGRDSRGTLRLWRQGLAETSATALEGTDRGYPVVVSPNNRSFIMVQRQKLVRVDLAGGTPIVLTDAPEIWGVTWIDDATIVFSRDRALWRMSASGGTPETIRAPARPDVFFIWPELIPGTNTLLYIENLPLAEPRQFRLHALDLATGQSRFVGEVPSRVLYSDGHLLAARDGSFVALPFDASTLKITGEPVVLADAIHYFKPRGDAFFSVSSNGLLVYDPPGFDRHIRWFDRSGNHLGVVGPPSGYAFPAFTRDGRHLAIAVADPRTAITNIWIYGTTRPTRERLAFSDRYESTPLWTPDRRWIIYQSDRSGVPDLYRRRADGSGAEELLYAAPGLQTATGLSADGKSLLFTTSHTGATGSDVMLLSLADRTARPLVQTPAAENSATFSPDDRWFAYASDESGNSEIYVRAFPDGDKVQISTGGGTMPRWSPDGRELFYVNDRDVMVADVSGPLLGTSDPRRLFTLDAPVNSWQVAPDGRFLIITVPDHVINRDAHLIVNWTSLLK